MENLKSEKQDLYKGDLYEQGFLKTGKKLLVVGHQSVSRNNKEKERYKTNPLEYLKEEGNRKDNTSLVKSLIDGTWKKWVKEDKNRKSIKTYLQFGRMLSGNTQLELGSEESNNLWESIAFCNFLQIPHFKDDAIGEDAPELYEYSKTIFIDYLKEAKPDHVIVWGTRAYNCVRGLAIKNIDDRHCEIILDTGDVVPVLRINHPCIVREGYEKAHEGLEQFLNG